MQKSMSFVPNKLYTFGISSCTGTKEHRSCSRWQQSVYVATTNLNSHLSCVCMWMIQSTAAVSTPKARHDRSTVTDFNVTHALLRSLHSENVFAQMRYDSYWIVRWPDTISKCTSAVPCDTLWAECPFWNIYLVVPLRWLRPRSSKWPLPSACLTWGATESPLMSSEMNCS